MCVRTAHACRQTVSRQVRSTCPSPSPLCDRAGDQHALVVDQLLLRLRAQQADVVAALILVVMMVMMMTQCESVTRATQCDRVRQTRDEQWRATRLVPCWRNAAVALGQFGE